MFPFVGVLAAAVGAPLVAVLARAALEAALTAVVPPAPVVAGPLPPLRLVPNGDLTPAERAAWGFDE